MTTFRIALEELLRKTGVDDFDFLREGLRVLAQGLMELEVSQRIGADRYERSAERSTCRNGYRERQWDTPVGTIDLQIPKLRKGSYMPSFLEPRRRAEKAIVAVVLEAYVNGVSTRKVDDLVQALGMTGVSRSQVSLLCAELDEVVQAFRNRPLEGRYPYVWLDAKSILAQSSHSRQSSPISPCSRAPAIAWSQLQPRRPGASCAARSRTGSTSACASPTTVSAA